MDYMIEYDSSTTSTRLVHVPITTIEDLISVFDDPIAPTTTMSKWACTTIEEATPFIQYLPTSRSTPSIKIGLIFQFILSDP